MIGNKSRLGQKLSEETKLKMSLAKKGKVISEETRLKISKRLLGKKLSDETKEKIRQANIGRHHTLEVCKKMSEDRKGEKSIRWKGGITPLHSLIRNSEKYKKWKKFIYERDDYTCRLCCRRGGNLEAHHIKSFSDFPEVRFDIENGLTLCIECHDKLHSRSNLYGEGHLEKRQIAA